MQPDFVNNFYHLEDDKCQQDEIDGDGDEIAIGKDRDTCSFEGIEGSWHIIRNGTEHNKEVGEVNPASQEGRNEGHDDVIDQ